MALIGAINKVSSDIGQGLQLVDTLFQRQITVRDKDNVDDVVLLNVVNEQELDFVVEITEKPVADLGGARDYISRTSTPLTLDCEISNRNIDLSTAPLEFMLQHAGSFLPEVAGAINAAASIGSQFFDLGADEIDKKINTLLGWQLEGVQVEVLGLRLNVQNYAVIAESFAFFIEKITPRVSPDTGDNVGLTIVFKNMLNVVKEFEAPKKGALQSETLPASLIPEINPFEAVA